MKKVSSIKGKAAPLKHANIDTDIIMPKQFLKSIKRTGYGDFVFDAWRYQDKGELGMDCNKRPLNPDFPLNQLPYQNAKILLALENFGCGSSREHAVWGLVEYGIEAVIAPSFADIFFNNAIKNGLLPIILPEEQILALFSEIEVQPGQEWVIELNNQTLTTLQNNFTFEIAASDKNKLMNGLDEIALTLQHAQKIKEYENLRKQEEPWIFNDIK